MMATMQYNSKFAFYTLQYKWSMTVFYMSIQNSVTEPLEEISLIIFLASSTAFAYSF